MKSWKEHRGFVCLINRDDIDTDQILPKQFMKIIDKSGFGKYLFFNWRYTDEKGESLNSEFSLNRFQNEKPSILITGKNFGCGSSREHAVWALSDFGFNVIIGESFGDIFSINASKNGIALIVLELSQLTLLKNWIQENGDEKITVDLENYQIRFGKEQMMFQIEEAMRKRILLGMDDIDETWKEKHRIDTFSLNYSNEYPFLRIH